MAQALAYAFLAAPAWDRPSLAAAGRETFGRSYRWLSPVIRPCWRPTGAAPTDQPRALARVIVATEPVSARAGARRVGGRAHPRPALAGRTGPGWGRGAGRCRRSTTSPSSPTRCRSCRASAWLADPRGCSVVRRAGPLHLYRYRWVERPGRLPRLLEAPTPLLRQVLRRLLHEVLDLVPPPRAAHGFVPGRSAVTHARQHVGTDVVVSLDLRHFFTAVTRPRAYGRLPLAGLSRAGRPHPDRR